MFHLQGSLVRGHLVLPQIAELRIRSGLALRMLSSLKQSAYMAKNGTLSPKWSAQDLIIKLDKGIWEKVGKIQRLKLVIIIYAIAIQIEMTTRQIHLLSLHRQLLNRHRIKHVQPLGATPHPDHPVLEGRFSQNKLIARIFKFIFIILVFYCNIYVVMSHLLSYVRVGWAPD